MMRKLFLLICCMLISISTFAEKKKVLLPKGTIIAIKTTTEVNTKQKQHRAVTCVVAGDVYDKEGEYVLIEGGAPADVQVQVVKATLVGGEAQVTFTPISVAAFNGRLVGMNAKAVYFNGNDALLTSRKQLILQAGTTFVGKTSTDMWFTIDVD